MLFVVINVSMNKVASIILDATCKFFVFKMILYFKYTTITGSCGGYMPVSIVGMLDAKRYSCSVVQSGGTCFYRLVAAIIFFGAGTDEQQ